MDRDQLATWLHEGLSLKQIGQLVDRDHTTVGYWAKKHGLVANGRDRHAPKGPIARAQLEELIDRGMTLEELAARFERGVSSIRHWLKHYALETRLAERQRIAVEARVRGDEAVMMICPRHGLVRHRADTRVGVATCTGPGVDA